MCVRNGTDLGLMINREAPMEPRDIYITNYDLTRLKELLQVGIGFAERDRPSLESLQGELDRAHIVYPAAVPHGLLLDQRFV